MMNDSQVQLFQLYNYSVYSNGTISNFTNCYLINDEHTPIIESDGMIYNGQSCDSPVKSLASHGAVGIVTACFCFFLIPLLLVNIAKYWKGKPPLLKRRMEFIWITLLILALAVGGFAYIDVDRNLVQGAAMKIFSFTFQTALPISIAILWHVISTYGFGLYRQRIVVGKHAAHFSLDHWIFVVEYYAPIVFYVFNLMGFFLAALHPWTKVVRGDGNAATDGRFKASSVLLAIAWVFACAMFIVYSFVYKLDRRGRWVGMVIMMISILPRIVYQFLETWSFTLNASNVSVNAGLVFGLGFCPPLILAYTVCIYGWAVPSIAELEKEAIHEECRQRKRRTTISRDNSTRSTWGIGSEHDMQCLPPSYETMGPCEKEMKEETNEVEIASIESGEVRE